VEESKEQRPNQEFPSNPGKALSLWRFSERIEEEVPVYVLKTVVPKENTAVPRNFSETLNHKLNHILEVTICKVKG